MFLCAYVTPESDVSFFKDEKKKKMLEGFLLELALLYCIKDK
jgi:hypothetical protein